MPRAAEVEPHSQPRIVFGILAGTVWVLAVFAFISLLAFENSQVGPHDLSCPVQGQDSVYADSHWSWFPPGAVCEFDHGDEGPSWWRVAVIAALLAVPAAVVVRRRGSRSR